MEILHFTLKGQNAFFKKPDVNTYVYYTYGNVHKVALLGMLGAVLGYDGYTKMHGYEKQKKQLQPKKSYPEFYEKLKNIKISILPSKKFSNGVIPKKVQAFNNSVGYASKEAGGNLIVTEQWLEKPEWEICILLDCEEALKIKEKLCSHKCIYYPYLGKNDHPADIVDVKVEKANQISEKMGKISCFVPEDLGELSNLNNKKKKELKFPISFIYKEALPIDMDGWTNQYIMKKMLYTDGSITVKDTPVYELNDKKRIIFY